jgi:hypothetical protein
MQIKTTVLLELLEWVLFEKRAHVLSESAGHAHHHLANFSGFVECVAHFPCDPAFALAVKAVFL